MSVGCQEAGGTGGGASVEPQSPFVVPIPDDSWLALGDTSEFPESPVEPEKPTAGFWHRLIDWFNARVEGSARAGALVEAERARSEAAGAIADELRADNQKLELANQAYIKGIERMESALNESNQYSLTLERAIKDRERAHAEDIKELKAMYAEREKALQVQLEESDQKWSFSLDKVNEAARQEKEQHDRLMKKKDLDLNHVKNENAFLIQDVTIQKTIIEKHAAFRLAELYDAKLELEIRRRGMPLSRSDREKEGDG